MTIDTNGIRAWCNSTEETFKDDKNVPHQFLDKALEYLRACANELDKAYDKLGVEPEPEPIEVPENVRKYLRWKSSCTDAYGDELLSYLLYHTEGASQYPQTIEQHRAGWEALRAMPYEQRERIIKQVFGGAVEGG